MRAGLASLLLAPALWAAAAAYGAPVRRVAGAPPPSPPTVDPGWKARGWRSVVPHAYVLRRRVTARTRPDTRAAAAFFLRGGARVPVLEQGRKWWRVSGAGGRSGWVPVADLEPHASWVLLDARTGRVLRRVAAKGQWGAVSDGESLWAVADTGITRMLPGERPRFWSNPVYRGQDHSLPTEAVWTPDRDAFYVVVEHETSTERTRLGRVSIRSGETELKPIPGLPTLEQVTRDGLLLLRRSGDGGKVGPQVVLYDPVSGQERASVPGHLQAAAPDGTVVVRQGKTLVRCSRELKPEHRFQVVGELTNVCLSVDARFLAVSSWDDTGAGPKSRIQILSAVTLTPVASLTPARGSIGAAAVLLAGDETGWTAVILGEREDAPGAVVRYTRSGRQVGRWRSGMHAVSPDGRMLYCAREKDLLAVSLESGAVRRTPLQWRRPLPRRYLPKPAERQSPTHLDTSSLTVSPDGKTLILTEWLNGDPAG